MIFLFVIQDIYLITFNLIISYVKLKNQCLDGLNKPINWIINKHFKESLHPNYKWKWTFTNPNTNSQVDRMSWIKIKYSRCIKYKATPYDSEYDKYLENRYYMTPFQYLYK